MADYRRDPFSFEATIEAALLAHALPHSCLMADPSSPSSIRVFGKSLYVLAAGWLVSVAWLWAATVRQSLDRSGAWPEGLALSTVVVGLVPAVFLALLAMAMRKATGTGPARTERREWNLAFWWSLFPNVMLLATVWLLIAAAR
jgi:hypothetical protein